jgi:outer membrane protein assembly factor BamB
MDKRYYRRRRKKAVLGLWIALAAMAVIAAAYYLVITDMISKKDDGEEGTRPTGTPVEEDGGLKPDYLDATNPFNFGFRSDIMSGDKEVDDYFRSPGVSFPSAEDYTDMKGILTFRGNNYRNAPNFGTATVEDKKLEIAWRVDTGSIGRWAGSGWTGQPLIVEWPEATRNVMNIKDEKKQKDDLKEVVLASLDGKVYFMDLDDGSFTRDTIHIGAPVKGTASIDPRGYPLYYVGQGLNSQGSDTECDNIFFRIFSLVDGRMLYKIGTEKPDPFAHRTDWQAYDSSPLIDAKSDTLVEPGENGILYTLKLNAQFDAEKGFVSIDPGKLVKYRYTTDKNRKLGVWGMENSAVGWKRYAIFTDNTGLLQCVDLNTLKNVYMNDLTDDSDATMVLEETDDGISLYTGSEVDLQEGISGNRGTAYIRKINGLTGETLWERSYACCKGSNIDGGVLGSPVLGQHDLNGLVIYSVTMTGSESAGKLVALDKSTGKTVWEHAMDKFGWSSPVPVYTKDGRGYIVQCDSAGRMYLIDGKTGEVLSSVDLEHNVEASPAVYNDMICVGTRGGRIYGVRIK